MERKGMANSWSIVILLIIAVAAVGVVNWAVFKPGSEETALKAGVGPAGS